MESSRPGCGSLTDLPPRSTPELEALRDLDWVNGRFLPRGTGQRNSTAWEEALVGMGIGRGCAGQGLLRWEEFNLESTWRTLQQQMLQSGGFLVFVTAVNLLLLKAYKLNRWRVPRLFNVPSLEILLGLMLLQGITQSAAGSMGTAAAGGGRQALAGGVLDPEALETYEILAKSGFMNKFGVVVEDLRFSKKQVCGVYTEILAVALVHARLLLASTVFGLFLVPCAERCYDAR